MNRAILFLVLKSLRGRLIQAARLVKKPRYLLGFLLTLGWMALWLLPWMRDRDRDAGGRLDSLLESAATLAPAIQILVGLAVALLLSLWWLWPYGRPNIGLKETELQLLLPSPMPRREIILFATLKAQPPILFGCGLMTLFFRAPSWHMAAQHFAGLWLALTIWDLHSKGKRLWLGRQRELPRKTAAARWAVLLAILAVFWLTVGWGLTRIDLTQLRSVEGGDRLLELATIQVERFGRTAGGWAVTPFGWLAAPMLANLPGLPASARLLSFLGPLFLLVLHQQWLVRSQTRFEEATLEAARRSAREAGGLARHSRKSKRERARRPFRLSRSGTPEVAVFWKNMILNRRTPLTRQAAVGFAVAAGLALVCFAFPGHWAPLIAPVSGLVMLAGVPALGVGGFRNDFRADLKHVESMRPWPVSGWRLMLAQVLSPVAVAALIALIGAAILLASDWATFWRSDPGPASQFWSSVGEALGAASPWTSPLVVLTAAPLSLALAVFASALHNLAALAFPGWVPLGAERKDVAQHMGTNLLLTLIQMLGMFLALIPGVVTVAAIALTQTALLGLPLQAWEFPLLSLLASATPVALAAAAIGAGGRLWERLDPSRELLGG